MAIHGALVLNAKTGALLHSQKWSASYGMASCAKLASEDLRLSAMLFALHLNASHAVMERGPSNLSRAAATQALHAYHMGDVCIRFAESNESGLLLLLFLHEVVDPAGEFLISQLLQHLDRDSVFGSLCEHREPAPPKPRSSVKRNSFSVALHATLEALPDWAFQQSMAALGTLDAEYSVVSFAALHSKSVCAALERRQSSGDGGLNTHLDTKHRAASSNNQGPASDARAQMLLRGLLGMEDAEAVREPSPPRENGCCAPFRRKKPPVRARPTHVATSVPAPKLFWRDLSSCSGADSAIAEKDDQHLHLIMHDLHAACRHRAVRGAGVLHTLPARLGPPEHGSHELIIFLIRSPLLFRFHVTLHTEDVDALLFDTISSLAAAVLRWVSPLALAMDSLQAQRQSATSMATSRLA
jgi:hypothetical protein